MVERYYDRLSKNSGASLDKKGDEEDDDKQHISRLDKMSYEEISLVAAYLDHTDVESFRRLSK